jgi:hypothetical protein
MFIARYDDDGNEIWVKRFGGNNPNLEPETGSLAIDTINNYLYYAGAFCNSMTIDTHTVTSASSFFEPFLAKFDYDGNCLWIINAQSPALNEYSNSVYVNNNGDVYWNFELRANGSLDTFNLLKGAVLAKISPIGDVMWARREFIDAVAWDMTEHNNSFYFIGKTSNDTASVDTLLLNSTNVGDVILAKTDTMGNVIWGTRFGGTGGNYGVNIDFDNYDNMYICGSFMDTLIYNTDTIIASSLRDMFFAKLDINGNLIWIKQSFASGALGAYAYGLVTDDEGSSYLTGKFSGNASFGTINLNTSNTTDMFVARYDSAGNCIGVVNFGEAIGYGVQTDNSGSVYCSGSFTGDVSIGSTNLINTSGGGYTDIFLAKLDAITGGTTGGRAGSNELVIYANPNSGSFNIKVPGEVRTFKNAVLIIYDNNGRETSRFALDKENDFPRFDIVNAAKGMYTVKLVQGDKSYTGKLVVQ